MLSLVQKNWNKFQLVNWKIKDLRCRKYKKPDRVTDSADCLGKVILRTKTYYFIIFGYSFRIIKSWNEINYLFILMSCKWCICLDVYNLWTSIMAKVSTSIYLSRSSK